MTNSFKSRIISTVNDIIVHCKGTPIIIKDDWADKLTQLEYELMKHVKYPESMSDNEVTNLVNRTFDTMQPADFEQLVWKALGDNDLVINA